MSKKEETLYPFYLYRGDKPLNKDRAYPFSHTYGSNITICIEPHGTKFLSTPRSTVQGIETKYLTLSHIFGSERPIVKPKSVLFYEGQALGFRFISPSAFTFDIELTAFSEAVINYLAQNLPSEFLVTKSNGEFTTEFEETTRQKVVDLSENRAVIEYIAFTLYNKVQQ